MRRSSIRWIAFVSAAIAPIFALLTILAANPRTADAHPLGNFTVNRYSRIELYSDAIRIRYVLDMAEIPAFSEIDAIDLDGDGTPSAQENEDYLSRETAEILGNLSLTVGGSAAELRAVSQEISYPEGQAGLRTLRLSLLLEAPAGESQVSIQYRDNNYADRIGWKEIVVQPAEGVAISSSTAATEDVSRELTAYPEDLLSSPLDITSASLSYTPGNGATAPIVNGAAAVLAKAPSRAGSGFASLIDTENLTLPVMLLSLLLALGFGAIHALEPGHGKTFVAAYFVGVKGTARQAMSLGLIIAATHTVGVLAIGLVTLFGSRFILPERLYPWLSLASGLMILALGVRLILDRSRNWRLRRRFFARVRRRSEEPEEHDHDHEHGHSHSHEPPADGAPPWRSLLALGLADGLTPSPSALVVLLAAVSLDRIGLGILLIVAFSVGLAAVLTLVCLSLVYARRFLAWMSERKGRLEGKPYLNWLAGRISGDGTLMRVAPVGGAVALMAVGLLLTIRALSQQGLPIL